MSGLEVLAVVACVAGVVSAYHDGAGLIARIKDKRTKKKALEDVQTKGLEDSLALGPPIVEGQYNQDYQRFRERYAQGDQIARESLKDIIIHLQSTLLTNLQHAWYDDSEIDFRTLQIVSDESRVKAVLTLCQLYQRLSVQDPIAPGLPAPQVSYGMASQTLFRPAGRADTMNTMASTSPYITSERTSVVSNTSTASSQPPKTPDSSFNETFAAMAIHQSSGQPFLTERKSSNTWKYFGRKPKRGLESSTTTFLAPSPLPQHLSQSTDAASVSSGRTNDWLLDKNTPTRVQADQVSIVSSDIASTTGSYYWGPDEITITANPWSQDRSPSEPRPGPPNHNPTSSLEVVRHPVSAASAPTLPTISRTSSMSLYLPCEENKFAGFCKGAWKLQIGMKKAMTAEYRPSGIYGQIPFWRCQKCSFEGPMMGKDKASRSFDNRIRENNGVRYRWVFLAKSHTYTRSMGKCTDGSFGTFGCIFCCAEQSKVPPMFGNAESLMNHLQTHRDRPPTGELLYRTKCIVGRIAAPGEDWDINLPARVQEIPA